MVRRPGALDEGKRAEPSWKQTEAPNVYYKIRNLPRHRSNSIAVANVLNLNESKFFNDQTKRMRRMDKPI